MAVEGTTEMDDGTFIDYLIDAMVSLVDRGFLYLQYRSCLSCLSFMVLAKIRRKRSSCVVLGYSGWCETCDFKQDLMEK